MSTTILPAATAPPDISTRRCWDLAVKIFNTELTKDPSKILHSDKLNTLLPHCSFSELICAARDTAAGRVRERSKFRTHMDAFLTVMSRYAVVIDVMAQHSPYITALVWGALRLLIMTAAKEIELSEQIGNAVVFIAGEVGRWEQYLHLHAASPRVRGIIARLYAHMISFSVRSARLEETQGLAQYLRAATGDSAQQKILNILSTMKELSTSLERETRLACQQVQMEEAGEQRLFRRETHTIQDQILKMAKTRQLLDWLAPARPPPISPVRWEEGTCQWISRHTVYRNWEEHGCPSPLWISGIPGCGKTVIASYLDQNAPTRLVFSHSYALSGSQEHPAKLSLAASVLGQVLEAEVQGAAASLQPLTEQFTSCLRCHPSRLLDQLVSTLAAIPEDFTLLVDGLDECRDAEDLHATLQHLAELSAASRNARVVLVSRYKEDFRALLHDAFHLPIDQRVVASDITRFIHKEIDRNPKLVPLRHDIFNKVETEAQGMFLWARMMIDYIKTAGTPRRQRERLKAFPIGLSAAYGRYLTEKGAELEEHQLRLRRNIFSLLIAAERPLSIDEIATAVALRPAKELSTDDILLQPEKDIMEICWPLVQAQDGQLRLIHASVREFLLSNPPAAGVPKTSLRITLGDAHKYMARVCLNQLSQARFASVENIASLLLTNVCPELQPNTSTSPIAPRSTLYEYACLHWHHHVSSSPVDISLADQVNHFLHSSTSFISWAETRFQLRPGNDLSPVLWARAALLAWQALGGPSIRTRILLDDFFTAPYEQALQKIHSLPPHPHLPDTTTTTTTTMHILLLHRLGLFLNLASSQLEKRFSIAKQVASGAEATLGPHHPFTLRSLSALGLEMINRHQFSAAETLLRHTYTTQLASGLLPECYITLSYCALAMYHQLKLPTSTRLHEDACAGLLHTLGPASKKYAKGMLFLAWALEAQGALDRALDMYEMIWKQWAATYTPDEPLGMMAQAGLVTASRKKGCFGEAMRHGAEVLANRQRAYGGGNRVTVDIALNMAIVCREAGGRDQARAYLDLAVAGLEGIEGDGDGDGEDVGDAESRFVRVCLARRIEASLLVAGDGGDGEGERGRAVGILRDVLRGAKVNAVADNRELLLVRLELADLLRREGKTDEALECFAGLVTPLVDEGIAGCLGQKSHSTMLEVAEMALRSIMDNDLDSAHATLAADGLCWERDSAYWIPEGGPFAGI